MTREQARALLLNIDLIRHYAQNGDVGHRLIDFRGNQIRICPARSINLSGLHPDRMCLYVAVKPRFVMSGGVLMRRERCFTESIRPEDVLEPKAQEGKT